MTANRKRRIRTAIQSMVSLVILAIGVDLGPVVDLLELVGISTDGLGASAGSIDPETAATLTALLGVISVVVTKLHQALDKTAVPSLVVPEVVDDANPDTDPGDDGEGEQVA